MSQELRVTPEVLEEQGTALVSYAEEMNDIVEKVVQKIGEIDDGWDGEAINAFLSEYQAIEEALKNAPQLLSDFGEATKQAAKAYAEADASVGAAFSKR